MNMERQRRFEHDRFGNSGDGPPGGDGLDQQRGEIDGLLRAADRVFDSINNLHAQQYLEQNLQTGGQ
jgi:hypothetical protein